MSQLGFFHRLALNFIASPILSAAMKKTGVHFYHYAPKHDRLFAMTQTSMRLSRFMLSQTIDSDGWWSAVRSLDLKNKVVLDIGANTGYTAAWFSTVAQKVIAVEPHPDNFALILEQLRIRAVNNVTTVQAAVSDHEGSATLFCKPRAGHHALDHVGATRTVGQLKVPCRTLDSICEEHQVDQVGLLKIDVEGFEAEVIRGARKLLQEQRVETILFEYSPGFYRRRGLDELEPIRELRDLGYEVSQLDGRVFSPQNYVGRGRCNQGDLIARAA